jgi:hypothetical protein
MVLNTGAIAQCEVTPGSIPKHGTRHPELPQETGGSQ